jgi:Lar family restriction alleviation protein
MDKLLNCPFCGSQANYDDSDICVVCSHCEAAQSGETESRAIAQWNRRAPSAVEQELRGMVQAFLDLDHNDYTQDGHDTGCKWCGAYRKDCSDDCILTKASALLAKKQ